MMTFIIYLEIIREKVYPLIMSIIMMTVFQFPLTLLHSGVDVSIHTFLYGIYSADEI